MNKNNTFESSKFYMDTGDVLHMIIKDETGTAVTIELVNADDPDTAEDSDP